MWQLAWSLIFIANFLLLNPNIAKIFGIVLLVIYLHLSYNKYLQTAKSDRIFSSVLATLKTGILRIYIFLIPYLLMAIVLVLVLQLYYVYRYLPDKVQIVIFGFILLIWMGWARIYVARILEIV